MLLVRGHALFTVDVNHQNHLMEYSEKTDVDSDTIGLFSIDFHHGRLDGEKLSITKHIMKS